MGFRNAILAGLSEADLNLMQPEPVNTTRGNRLERCGRHSEHVYFLDQGVASAQAPNGVQVGMIGREGMTSLAPVMTGQPSSFDTAVLIAGRGWRVALETVRSAFQTRGTFHSLVMSYAHAFIAHLAAGSAANADKKLEERLARWLATAGERLDNDEVGITHDRIAQALGVRRAGVTIALSTLEQKGLVDCQRGVITIVSREGLIAASGGAYAAGDTAR